VNLSTDGVVRDSVTRTLAPGEATTEQLVWSTVSADAGSYLATVSTRDGSASERVRIRPDPDAGRELITGCTRIESPGSYSLGNDVGSDTGVGPCLSVGVADVEIEGNGHTIGGGSAGDGTGIVVEPSGSSEKIDNVTLTGLTVSSWADAGVAVRDASVTIGGRVTDGGDPTSVLNAGTDGVRATDASLTVTGTEVRNTGRDGIRLSDSSVRVLASTISDSDAAGIKVSRDSSATVRNTTVTGATDGIASDGGPLRVIDSALRDVSASGVDSLGPLTVVGTNVTDADTGITVANRGTIRTTTVSGTETGISVARQRSATVRNSSVHDAENSGIRLRPGSTARVENSSVDGRTGSEGITVGQRASVTVRASAVTNTTAGVAVASGGEIRDSSVRFTRFQRNEVAISSDGEPAFDAMLNFYGRPCPTPSTRGSVRAYPVVHTADRAGPGAVNTTGPTQSFRECLELEAGGTYAVGFPGTSGRTLSETFTDFEGAVFLFNGTTGSWELADGDETPGALEAVVVKPTTDTRAWIEYADSATRRTSEREFRTEGWHLVAPPAYATARGAFGSGTVGVVNLTGGFEPPATRWGMGETPTGYQFADEGSGPRLSPFAGYFVYVDRPGTLQAAVPEGVTAGEIYDLLNATAPDGEVSPS